MLHAVSLKRTDVQMADEGQGHEHLEALRGRRGAVYFQIAVRNLNWIHPASVHRGQVVHGQRAAQRLNLVYKGLSQRPVIEVVSALADQGLVGCGQVVLMQHPAGIGLLAVVQEDFRPAGEPLRNVIQTATNHVGVAFTDGEAAARQIDGIGEDFSACARSVGVQQLHPAGQTGGRAHAVRTAGQVVVAPRDGIELQGHGRGEVQTTHATLGRHVDHGRAHAGQSGHVRLDDIERSRGGNGSIEGVAAVGQDAGTRLRRQGMRRRYYAAAGGNAWSPSKHTRPTPCDPSETA